MVPAFPGAQEQFLYCPTQLGPTLSEGSYQAFSPGHLLPNLFWLSLWAACVFFHASAETWAVQKRDKTGMSPTSHQGTRGPSVSPSSLLASVAYTSPFCEA